MDTIADHLLHPEVTIDEHFRRSLIALGRSLAPRRAIYLDTKFWILLRDAERFPDRAEGADLLDLLRRGVADGTLFCPISESVFVELMKQSDPGSRLATASLIDELSLGVTLIEQDMRLATEIAHAMYAKSGRNNLHPLKHLVWCKLSFVLGFLYPTGTGFDPATELAVQKAYFDHMWAIPLRQMVTMIGDADMPGKDLSDIAAMLNDGIAAHADELRSFQQAYAAEVRGIVDLVGGKAVDIMLTMARDDGVVVASPTPKERRISEGQFKNLFAIALERNRARDALRTMHIMASFHASVRWNKGRKFRGNDLLDFHHAAAALAYCDAFFTERSLHTTVTQKPLTLDRLYNCHVASDAREAAAYLRRLAGVA